jgi:hypothetical protein
MKKRKIPRPEFVIHAIKEVLRKRRIVQSQEDLCYLVLQKLKRFDPEFVLSPRRVKNMVLKIPNIEIKAKTKRIPKMTKLEKCPVCKKKIGKIHGKNLLNKKIQIGYVCKRCGYTTDLESFMPMKYIFILKNRK